MLLPQPSVTPCPTACYSRCRHWPLSFCCTPLINEQGVSTEMQRRCQQTNSAGISATAGRAPLCTGTTGGQSTQPCRMISPPPTSPATRCMRSHPASYINIVLLLRSLLLLLSVVAAGAGCGCCCCCCGCCCCCCCCCCYCCGCNSCHQPGVFLHEQMCKKLTWSFGRAQRTGRFSNGLVAVAFELEDTHCNNGPPPHCVTVTTTCRANPYGMRVHLLHTKQATCYIQAGHL